MGLRMVGFFITALLVLGGATTYMGLRLTTGLPKPWRGLVWAALVGLLVRLVEPFAVGRHRLDEMWIYTNRGTGSWGPPIRLGTPQEITLLRLTRAKA